MSLLRIDDLDGLERLRLDNQQNSFPAHFHDTFCLTLVRSGVEITASGNRRVHCTAGSISLSQPGEVHANPLLAGGGELSFTTLYPSPDLVDYLLGRRGVRFRAAQFSAPDLVPLFGRAEEALQREDVRLGENALSCLLARLVRLDEASQKAPSQRGEDAKDTLYERRWEELLAELTSISPQTLGLDEMAARVCLSRFHFAKQFKLRYGMAPGQYVLLLRVQRARKAVLKGVPLNQITFDYGFFDQAHFSRSFKRFVGLSPNQYHRQQLAFTKNVQA